MAELHFLRPLWLPLLPVGAWLIWQLLRGRAHGGGWRSVVAAELRTYVLAEPEVLRDSRAALIAAVAAWAIAVVALALGAAVAAFAAARFEWPRAAAPRGLEHG